MANSYQYGLPEAAKSVFMTWWRTISSEHAYGMARAERAMLKRAGSLTAVACMPAYQRLYRDMAGAIEGPWRPFQQERVSALVALAAHVKDSSPMSLPQAMSFRPEGSDRNPVSELRFRRLLESPDMESLFSGLRRTMPLIEYKVSPVKLADDIFSWGDGVKKRWAYAYVWPK